MLGALQQLNFVVRVLFVPTHTWLYVLRQHLRRIRPGTLLDRVSAVLRLEQLLRAVLNLCILLLERCVFLRTRLLRGAVEQFEIHLSEVVSSNEVFSSGLQLQNSASMSSSTELERTFTEQTTSTSILQNESTMQSQISFVNTEEAQLQLSSRSEQKTAVSEA